MRFAVAFFGIALILCGSCATRQQPVETTDFSKVDYTIPVTDSQVDALSEHDRKLFRAIELAWDESLEARSYTEHGSIIIRFRLHSAGTISNVSEEGNSGDSVFSLLCRMAVEHPVPFEPFPRGTGLRKEYRDISIRFSK